MILPPSPQPDGLGLLTFNIGNPSPERAERQLAWLATREEDVLVLTGTRASRGCQLLADRFADAGYTVVFPQPEQGECGTMIVARIASHRGTWATRLDYLSARAASITLPVSDGAAVEVSRISAWSTRSATSTPARSNTVGSGAPETATATTTPSSPRPCWTPSTAAHTCTSHAASSLATTPRSPYACASAGPPSW